MNLLGLEYKVFAGGDALNRLLERISVQLQYGHRVLDAVEELLHRAKKRGIAGRAEALILEHCRTMLYRGGNVAEGLSPWLSPICASLLANGATSGKLPEALNLAARLNRLTTGMTREALSGLAEPVMSTFLLYYFAAYISRQITASLGPMIKGHVGTLAAITMGIGRIAQSSAIWFVFSAVVLSIGVVSWSMPRWCGKARMVLDRVLPPYTIYRRLQGAVWLISYAALIESGMSVTSAIRRMRQTASPWLDERLRAALSELGRGSDIGKALRLSGHTFPSDDIIADMEVFSRFPNLQDKLMVLAEQSLSDTRERVRVTNKIISSASKAAVSIVFLVMMFGLISIISGVAASAGL